MGPKLDVELHWESFLWCQPVLRLDDGRPSTLSTPDALRTLAEVEGGSSSGDFSKFGAGRSLDAER